MVKEKKVLGCELIVIGETRSGLEDMVQVGRCVYAHVSKDRLVVHRKCLMLYYLWSIKWLVKD